MHKRNMDDDDAKLAPNSNDKIKEQFTEVENKIESEIDIARHGV